MRKVFAFLVVGSLLFAACAEEMGAALQRSAFSANVKERRDYSCALFGGSGNLISQAAHIPQLYDVLAVRRRGEP